MINTLYLPELREALAQQNARELEEFCTTLHPARTAEFMEGLQPQEAWSVLKYADLETRAEIFRYLDEGVQEEIVEHGDRTAIAELLAEMPPDDRVDVLKDVSNRAVDELVPMLPLDERRATQRLYAYPEETAGALMTTEVAKLSEDLSVRQAIDEIQRQAEEQETVYYLYVVDEGDHLRGLVSARQLLAAMGRPDTPIKELMETEVIHVNAMDDQEAVAQMVERYDLLAIPVVDIEHRMLGIVTYDDVMDVVREEATEDAHRIAAVSPLEEGYLDTPLMTLSWKRGMWLMLLFVGALLTAFALGHYEHVLSAGSLTWLVMFVPLVISSGGNSGNQSATLIITALTTGDVALHDWARIVLREIAMGILLGSYLAAIGFLAALFMTPNVLSALVVPITLVLVVVAGTLCGSVLPLLFKRIGLDPALMSSPFVAGIIDIVGIVIYMNVALALVGV